MTDTSLTLRIPIDHATLEVLSDFHAVSIQCDVAYVLIGARARDLVLHHGYGAPASRATADIDFALQVRNWEAFHAVRDALLAYGYGTSSIEHRLLSNRDGGRIDIVPFGEIANHAGVIAWPPEGATKMTVMGFEESYQSACTIHIDSAMPFELRVASPESLLIMKLIAWTERDPGQRRKDAADIAYLLHHYERIDADRGTLYENPWFATLERYGYDTKQASAHLLGHRIKQIAQLETLTYLVMIFHNEIRGKTTDVLLREMASNRAMTFEGAQSLIEALVAGLEF